MTERNTQREVTVLLLIVKIDEYLRGKLNRSEVEEVFTKALDTKL